jgi:6-phosphogluconolactonase
MVSCVRLKIAFFALTFLLPGQASAASAYIGSYTPEPTARGVNHGEGIYMVDVDAVTGLLANARLVAKTLSPSWLALSADNKVLYANSEVLLYGGERTGSVAAYAIAPDGALRELNRIGSAGAGPAYISLHPSGKFLLLANYYGGSSPKGGSFAVIRIRPDGSLGEMTDMVRPTGPRNPDTASDDVPGQLSPSSHETSRGHMIAPNVSGSYVVGDDAGLDKIFVWTLNPDSGKLTQVSITDSLPGSAPRHFVFSPGGKRMYQLQEQDSRVAVYDFTDGKLTQVGQTVSILPDGYAGSSTASELLISRDGGYLYAANRTQDSIAVLQTSAQGVKRIANVPTQADHPRSLTIDPSGRFLYSLNQRGDSVTTFRIGAAGIPQFTGHFMPLGSPAMMVFRPQ